MTDTQKAFEEWFPINAVFLSHPWHKEFARQVWKAAIAHRDKEVQDGIAYNEEQLVEDIAADICDTVSQLNGIAYTPQQWMGTARKSIKHFKYHSPMHKLMEEIKSYAEPASNYVLEGNIDVVSIEEIEEALAKYKPRGDL